MLRNDQTILEGLASLSVEINGVIVPGQLIEKLLAEHSLNLVVSNDDDLFKVSLPGSATAVRYRGRELLLVTQHQLEDVDPARVGMITDSGSLVITSGGRRGYQPRADTDANDIVAFDFTEPCRDRPELRSRFFNLTHAPRAAQRAGLLGVLLMGYPAEAQSYTVHEDNRLGLARLHVPCLPATQQPTDDALLHLKPTRPLTLHPDGMSGGAAFAFVRVNNQISAHFAGLILRAGRDDFYVLKAAVVLAFLNSLFPW